MTNLELVKMEEDRIVKVMENAIYICADIICRKAGILHDAKLCRAVFQEVINEKNRITTQVYSDIDRILLYKKSDIQLIQVAKRIELLDKRITCTDTIIESIQKMDNTLIREYVHSIAFVRTMTEDYVYKMKEEDGEITLMGAKKSDVEKYLK